MSDRVFRIVVVFLLLVIISLLILIYTKPLKIEYQRVTTPQSKKA